MGAEVPGNDLYVEPRAKAADCAEGSRPLQGTYPGIDATDARDQFDADDRTVVSLPEWVAGLLRLLPNALGAGRIGLVDTTAPAKRRLEAVEAWEATVCGASITGRGQGLGGSNRREPSWSVAACPQPRSQLCIAECLFPVAWPADSGRPADDVTSRTAVYGPVRTVV